MRTQIKLSDTFDYKKLLRFTFPSIIMLVFTSIYGMVDGFFVSNFVGKTSFAAVNLIFPYIMVLSGIGFMFGTGASALIGKYLGEGKRKRANSSFSLVVYTSIIVGVIIGALGILFLKPIAILFGAEGELLRECIIYGAINFIALPAFLLQSEFQSLFVTAEKPRLGLYTTIFAGVMNMVLDALLIAVLDLGIVGAGVATAMSQVVGGVVPLIYFSLPNSSLLKLGATRLDFKALLRVTTNGFSELLSNISMSLVSMLYNFQLMKYAGEDGISAYGVLMYVGFIFNAVSIGYAVGISPVISFKFGERNERELSSLYKKSMTLTAISSALMFVSALALATPFSSAFVGYDEKLFSLTLRAFLFHSFCFIFTGYNIFVSAFFTALNDGVTSAIVSFFRTLIFKVILIFLCPIFWDIDGIWLSSVFAEFFGALLCFFFIKVKRKKYKY